ncbi:asparagine synthase-related protein [Falsirhodobacter sp. 20TX0035]|uniref:asparagine synthase-related protein n=1 Tax=Falsirhodobacter sp. 20TX0035 TaxID=3022019 RepID=UPI002330382D|nr:asparagine synthase-related protein [Falsirhodobacter sp. 20TX0035]MDB6454800.1 asparagine synthase-related protein [Falsirhodobacter sp. 20TX0035]
MSHFAVLGGIGRPILGLASAAMRMRAGCPDSAESRSPGDRLLQWGCLAQQGPLSLCGDLGLTDIPQLRADSGHGTDADPAQMVLSLWARHQEGALHRLNGCFAFTIHDARTGETWAVRDRMGVRPLAYAVEADRIVVASTIRLVRLGLSGATDIDRAWMADFLCGQDTSHERTAHAQIRRLPPGHLLRLSANGTLTTRGWYSLHERIVPSEADGAEALHEALRHATREACAGRSIATFLSGGLDSSTLSLLSVGPGEERAALSLRYDNPALDEGVYIDAVLAKSRGALIPENIPAADVAPDLRALLTDNDQPLFAPGLPGNRHLYLASRRMGYRDVLDGHGGDEVIDGGLRSLMHIAGRGAWGPALGLAWQHARFTGVSPTSVWMQLVAARGPRLLAALARRASRAPHHDRLEWRALLDPALVADTDLVARVQALHSPVGGDLPEGVRAHLDTMTAPLLSGALEVLDVAARSAGVTPHYPFYDHRVVELCVAQPDHALIAQGQPRSLLRRAMRDVLPEKVRQRRDKIDFLPNFWARLQRDPDLRRLLVDPQPLQGWVNIDTLRADGTLLQSDSPDPGAAFRIARALALATWFDLREAAPLLQHKAS